MTITTSNNFGTAKWIVASTAGLGTHTTIATALTAASSGDTIFVRPGTYTENLTLKAGVNIVAYIGDADTPNVTITGKATFTGAGTVTISGIRLTTNSDFFLVVSGSSASAVNLENCYLNCSNNTGISYTSSSSSSKIYIKGCLGNLGTTGIAVFAMTSTGTLQFEWDDISNSGNSTTANTISAGNLFVTWSQILNPITTSSTASVGLTWSSIQATNTTCLTAGSSGTNSAYHCIFASGTASAISVGNNLSLFNSTVASTNTNAITGAGTLVFENISWSSTSQLINTTTQTPKQQTVIQTFTGNGTYTPTAGMKYCIIECVGGGGGGGGTATSTASFYNGSGGGGGGGYARKLSTATAIGTSQTVTIGIAGTAGTAGNNAGGNGGDTSVGSICIGKGGTGGPGSAGGTAGANGGAGGVAGTGDFTIPGRAGDCGLVNGTAISISSTAAGGSSYFGAGGASILGNSANRTGPAGSNYGGGGGGATSFNNGGNVAGSAGTAGVVIITEYCY